MHPDAKTDALRLGSNGSGMALHIGRSFAADFGGGMQLGAVSSVDDKFSTTFGGEVLCSDEYEVLCCAMGGAIVVPQPASAGRIPANALGGGWEADGTPLCWLHSAHCQALAQQPGWTRARQGSHRLWRSGLCFG